MGIEFTKGVNKSVDTTAVAKEIKMDDFLRGLKNNDKKEMESIFNHYAGGDGVLSSDELTKAMEEVQKYAGKDNKMSGKEARENAAKIGLHIEGKDIKNFWSRIGENIKAQNPEDVLKNTYDKNGKLASQTEIDKDKNIIVTAYANGVVSKKTTTSADGKTVTAEEGGKKTVTSYDEDGNATVMTEFDEDGSPSKMTINRSDGAVIVDQYGAGGIRTMKTDKSETEETFDSDGSLQKKVLKEGNKIVTTDYAGAKGVERPTAETTVEGNKTTVKQYDAEGGHTQAVTEEGKDTVTTKHDKDGKLIEEKSSGDLKQEKTEKTLTDVQKEINKKLKDSNGKWTAELNALVAERNKFRKEVDISKAPAVITPVAPEKAPGRATYHKDFVYDESNKQTYKKGTDGKYTKFDADYVASSGGYRKGGQLFYANGTEIKEGSAKEKKAKMEGWRATTSHSDYFYDEKTKTHYAYDNEKKQFTKRSDIQQVYANGKIVSRTD